MGEKLSEADDLRRENVILHNKLQDYKKLEEDLMAQRVYEKARKQITAMLTFGGIAAVLAGVLGFKSLDDYAKRLANDALKSTTQAHIEDVLQAEARRQIADVVHQEQPKLEGYIRQQIVIATQPIGAPGNPANAPPTTAIVDYTAEMLPVRDQRNEGSSTGFAVAAALEYQIRKSLHQRVRLSPRFVYNYAREREHMLVVDGGATLADAVLVAKENGVVADEVWPYIAGQYASRPPVGIDNAKHYRATKTTQISSLAEIKAALANGPVVAGITVYESVFTTKSGIVPLPGPSERMEGGYPVCIVGYDDQRKLLKFEASWGSAWGDHGYGYISYDYAEKFLSTDNWALAL